MSDKAHYIVVGENGNATANIFTVKAGKIAKELDEGLSNINASGTKVRVHPIKEDGNKMYWRVRNKHSELSNLKKSRQTISLVGENKKRVAKAVQTGARRPKAA